MSISGFLLINKPAGVSSNYAVEYIKQLVGFSLGIGHAGTLDPFAEGLLILAIGKLATKQLTTLTASYKEYVVCAQLGILTDSLDPTGSVNKRHLYREIKKEELQEAIEFLGTQYIQIPPAYSAIKHNGRRLYSLMRNQKITALEMEQILLKKQRIVDIHSLAVESIKGSFFTLTMKVGAGMYVRSLINDLAIKLGTHATTIKLIRTKIGVHNLSDAIYLFDFLNKEDVIKHLRLTL